MDGDDEVDLRLWEGGSLLVEESGTIRRMSILDEGCRPLDI